jgi:copper chaperone NosL
MINKLFKITLSVAVIILLTACAPLREYPPVDIDSETDICAKCNMHVPNDMFGVEYITVSGDVKKFDDLGCMIKYMKANSNDIANVYVKDYLTEEWIDAKTATYVNDPEIITPMSNGVVSFKTKEDPEQFITKRGQGEIFDYDALLKFEWPQKAPESK